MNDTSPGTEPPVPPTPLPPVNPTEPPPGRPAEPAPTPAPAPEPPVVPPGSTGGPDAELTTVGQDYTVPTMDDVRAKIEGRFARAGGQAELDAASTEGRHQAQTEEARAKAAREVLDKIRASMREQ